MDEVLLRIYFIGLLAFVPSHDGKAVTVVIERAFDGHETSDGHRVEPHLPLLLTRGTCEGDCKQDRQRIARFIYSEPGDSNRRSVMRQLDDALQGGGAWILDGHDLEVGLPHPKGTSGLRFGASNDRNPLSIPTAAVPATDREAEEFGWLTRMEQVSPQAAHIDPDVLSPHPELGLVAARWQLDRGKLGTYRLVDTEAGVARVGFQPVAATSRQEVPRARALWVSLEVPLSLKECLKGIRFEAKPFANGDERKMVFKPKCETGSVAEVAVVNLPAWEAAFAAAAHGPQSEGPHFELFYKLSQARLEASQRRVPVLAQSSVAPPGPKVHQSRPKSPLLDGLNLLPPRGVHAHSLCVPTMFLPPGGDGG